MRAPSIVTQSSFEDTALLPENSQLTTSISKNYKHNNFNLYSNNNSFFSANDNNNLDSNFLSQNNKNNTYSNFSINNILISNSLASNSIKTKFSCNSSINSNNECKESNIHNQYTTILNNNNLIVITIIIYGSEVESKRP